MNATIFHGTRMTSICCRPPAPIEVHCVSVTDDSGGIWDLTISPRVTTPMRRRVVMANAIRYVSSKMEAIQ